MTLTLRRNRQTTHFSERIHVVKRRISVFGRGRGVAKDAKGVEEASDAAAPGSRVQGAAKWARNGILNKKI